VAVASAGQFYTSPQTDNHASNPPLSFLTGRMPFLPPNQQRQITENKPVMILMHGKSVIKKVNFLYSRINFYDKQF